MFVGVLKEWKWIGVVLGVQNLREISQTLLGLVAHNFLLVWVQSLRFGKKVRLVVSFLMS
jgi:hypothetical protein